MDESEICIYEISEYNIITSIFNFYKNKDF